MYELPLFPLQTVLFPGTPLYLHIFEERYQRMINLCLEEQKPFGVVLIRKGIEALGPLAQPYLIGCSAQIIDVKQLEGGRKNITAVGAERFRVLSLDYNIQPYLVGSVEPFPLANPSPQDLVQPAVRLRTQLIRYLTLFAEATRGRLETSELPSDPVHLSYLAASLLQASPENKQELLSIEAAGDLLEKLQALLRKEITLLKAVSKGGHKDKTSFSRN